MKRLVWLAMVTGFCLSMAAGTATWKGTYSNNWNEPGNWETQDCANGYPMAGDTAVFDNAEGGSVTLPAGGVSLAVINFPSGDWTFSGGELMLSADTPFGSTQTGTVTFECPVYFSSGGTKTVYCAKVFKNAVRAGASGRIFFRGISTIPADLHKVVFTGTACQCDFTNLANICAGLNNDTDTNAYIEMVVTDHASVRAAIVFNFRGSTITVSDGGKLSSTISGTAQSFDMTINTTLNVLPGGTVSVAGKFDLGQSKTATPNLVTVNLAGGTLDVNYFATTLVPERYAFTFSRPLGGEMGKLNVGSSGWSIKDGGPFPFAIADANDADPGTMYSLVADASGSRPLDGYAPTTYNGLGAVDVGTLALNAGLLTFTLKESDWTWTGNGGDGKFSTAANWYCNRTPTGGEALYFKDILAATTVENDIVGYTPLTITLRDTCVAPVTFTGEGMSGVQLINNFSSATPVFRCPVAFADAIRIMCSEENIDFAGGVTGTEAALLCDIARTLLGNYTFTYDAAEEQSWKPTADVTYVVPAGSTFNIPGTNYLHASSTKFQIDEGATMNVGTVRIRDANEHFLVKGTLNIGFLWCYGFTPSPFMPESSGTINCDAIGNAADKYTMLKPPRINVGAEGIFETWGANANHQGMMLQDGVTFGAYADWTFAAPTNSPIYRVVLDGTTTFDTTDSADGETPRTITIEAMIEGTGKIIVTGNGMLDISSNGGMLTFGGALEMQTGTTLKMNSLATLDCELILPEEGVLPVVLVAPDGLPRGAELTLFSNSGLAAEDLAAITVAVEDHPDVEGVLGLDGDGNVIYTVTASNTELAALTWRPQGEDVWSSAVAAWLDPASTAMGFRPFSPAVFDGQEAGGEEIAIAEDLTVGTVSILGERDYVFTGTGVLNGSSQFIVGGGGSVTFDGPALTYQPLLITNGVLRVVTNDTAYVLGASTSTITIRDRGALDLDLPTSDVQYSDVTHSKVIYVEGEGPDGLGAIRNPTCTTAPTYSFSEMHLTGDTTIGGPGRLDFRATSASARGKAAADLLLEGPDDATLTVKGQLPASNWGFVLVDVPVARVGRVVVDGGVLTTQGLTVFDVKHPIEVKNGGRFYLYSMSVECPNDFIVGEGDGMVKCGNGSVTTTGRIVVPEGRTLTMGGNLTHTGVIENYGTVLVDSGAVKFTGQIIGNGVFSGITFEANELGEGETLRITGNTQSATAGGFVLNGGTLEAQGMFTSGGAKSVPNYVFNSGTITLADNFTAQYFKSYVLWGDEPGGKVTVELNGHDFVCYAGCMGKSDVTIQGEGRFTTDSGLQGMVEGHWTVDNDGQLVNLSGGTAFLNGLELKPNTQVQLNIGANDASAVEMAVQSTAVWEDAKGFCGDFPYLVSHLKRLRMNTASPEASTVAFHFRGKFLVEPDQEGTWYFGGVYDDRLLLEIDGKTILETTGSGTPAASSTTLTAGWHLFRVVVWDNTGAQGPRQADWIDKMSLGWSIEEPAEPLKASSYQMFDTYTLKMSPMTTAVWSHLPEQAVAGTWKTVDNWAFTTVTNGISGIDYYGEDTELLSFNSTVNRLTGRFRVPEEWAGDWAVKVFWDDYVGLWIDGEEVAASPVNCGAGTGNRTMTAGWHEFEIRVGDGAGHFGPTPTTQTCAVRITLPNNLGTVAFNEKNFDITASAILPYPGLYGEVWLGEGSRLFNGSAFGGAPAAKVWCPVYGTVFGAGKLAGPFRFLGGKLGVSGSGKDPAVPEFDETASHAETLKELGGVECRFDSLPVREIYDLAPALGLTDEVARTLPVTMAVEGLEEARLRAYNRCSLRVVDGRLILKNPAAASTAIFLR